MYEKLSDKLLFDYYMIHSTRKDEVYCTIPFYLSKEEYRVFKNSSEILDKLVYRIMSNITTAFRDFQCFIPDFKYRDIILNLKRPLEDTFWVRYDSFLRANGGIFYSEFNYDKPCAQREILATGEMKANNNLNIEFRQRFKKAFKKLLKIKPSKEHYNIALLSDPCHAEEAHIMLLLEKELKQSNVEFIRVGPKNLYLENKLVYAFERPIDIILRLFPTEFSYEINDFDKILEVFENGKVDIVNDPRAIIGQCKNLYTYLWQLVKAKDKRLSDEEREVIISTLPHTEPFHESKISYILENKDELVLKPVYGRYSIDVFIGSLHSAEDWKKNVQYVLESGKEFIIQEFCKIKPCDSYYTIDGNFAFPTKAFANIGCFIFESELSGCCMRWSGDYLTTDDHTWITPIGIKSDSVKINSACVIGEERKKLWNKITERAMFEADFTGRYVKNFEYVGLDYITLEKGKYEELAEATSKIASIMDKTQTLLYNNIDYFADILGIENLKELLKYKLTEEFVFLARMDWAIDHSGNLKLLEINSETPAGLIESLYIDNIITEELNINKLSANKELRNKIIKQFIKIIKDYSKIRSIKIIGILSGTYYEDWYTANALYKTLKELPFEFVLGSIYDCTVSESGKVLLFGKELDAVYRYYPLDWFELDGMKNIKEALKNTLSINPTHTIISQSKAFFAVMYELLVQGFYSEEEIRLIKKYIPKTSLEAEKLGTYDYIVKPLLSREGNGVALACELKEVPDENHIYQERVHTLNVDYTVYDNISKTQDLLYPIFGAYVTGTEFAGIYTRLGKFVTENICIYTPVFIE
ncbi:glutathionylspermidine synthase family protein [Candidatus Clostridium radicumherbarum]|uniref:Glutathionylspermidine synthase family protein n=1 Tax=Candidatus Clostridium radicumherbarum TaxID=3381662 RepID=A0ABW8TLR7_9CLOT